MWTYGIRVKRRCTTLGAAPTFVFLVGAFEGTAIECEKAVVCVIVMANRLVESSMFWDNTGNADVLFLIQVTAIPTIMKDNGFVLMSGALRPCIVIHDGGRRRRIRLRWSIALPHR